MSVSHTGYCDLDSFSRGVALFEAANSGDDRELVRDTVVRAKSWRSDTGVPKKVCTLLPRRRVPGVRNESAVWIVRASPP